MIDAKFKNSIEQNLPLGFCNLIIKGMTHTKFCFYNLNIDMQVLSFSKRLSR